MLDLHLEAGDNAKTHYVLEIRLIAYLAVATELKLNRAAKTSCWSQRLGTLGPQGSNADCRYFWFLPKDLRKYLRS